MANYIVVYDSCILYSFTLRNLFVELAMAELFQAKWTNKINNEWIEALLKKNPKATKTNLEKTKSLLNNAVPDCIVEGYESLIPNLNLPDKNDCHVLAAAIRSNAQAIITENLKDFPKEILDQYDIEAINPDEFLHFQIDLAPGKVLEAIKKSRIILEKPKYSPQEYLQCLRKKGLIKTAVMTMFR